MFKKEKGLKNQTKTPASPLRKRYIARLVGRCVVLMLSVWIFFAAPQEFQVLDGMNFFEGFSIFHVLWFIWLVDMFCQLMPIRKHLALGSQKLFRRHFKPIREKINYKALKQHILTTTRSAGWVMLLWSALIGFIGGLYFLDIINKNILLLISITFYVCDLICVLIWCPFRLILKNRCCTTCRIFNWDHLMMFSPLVFVGGFYALSLFGLSLLVWLVWEISILLYPERFWEFSNEALKCSNCTDKLCTQYCQKLR